MDDQYQQMWDRLLLHIFIRDWTSEYRTGMTGLVNNFEYMTGRSIKDLKRVPNFHTDRMTVVRFVCGYLPRLARILIDKEKTHDDVENLVEKLQRWSIDTVRDRTATNERTARVREEKSFAYTRKVRKQNIEQAQAVTQFQTAHGIKPRVFR